MNRENLLLRMKSQVWRFFISLTLSLSLSLSPLSFNCRIKIPLKRCVFFPRFRLSAWKKREIFGCFVCRQKKKSRRALVLSSTTIKSIMFVVATPSKTPASSSASPSRSSRRCAVASASTIPSSSSSSSQGDPRDSVRASTKDTETLRHQRIM